MENNKEVRKVIVELLETAAEQETELLGEEDLDNILDEISKWKKDEAILYLISHFDLHEKLTKLDIDYKKILRRENGNITEMEKRETTTGNDEEDHIINRVMDLVMGELTDKIEKNSTAFIQKLQVIPELDPESGVLLDVATDRKYSILKQLVDILDLKPMFNKKLIDVETVIDTRRFHKGAGARYVTECKKNLTEVQRRNR